MTYAYDELYLPLAQRMLGDMYDFAVNTLKYKIDEFQKMFFVSGIEKQIAMGNPMYLAGKNGCEVAKEIVEQCTGVRPEVEDTMYLEKSVEYWIGWSLCYFQWETGYDFISIERAIPIEEMYGMYGTLHEADISVFVSVMKEKCQEMWKESALKRLRAYAKLSQSQLAKKSGVPLRQIQLFEQGQRDIKKTQGQTLYDLSKALCCSMEDLIC